LSCAQSSSSVPSRLLLLSGEPAVCASGFLRKASCFPARVDKPTRANGAADFASLHARTSSIARLCSGGATTLIVCLLSMFTWGQTQSLSVDVKVSKDSSTASSSISTPNFSTTAAKELLLAFVSSDAPQNGPNTTVTAVSGGGLTWQLVQRTNVQLGTSEIWRAFALAPLSNAKVTVSLSQSVASSVTVVSFIGADPSGINGSGAIGAVGTGNGPSGAPSASLVTTRNNSWVYGVGNDWDHNISRTLGPNQTLVHQYLATVHDTYWVQSETNPTPQSGTTVVINDTAPTTDRYNLSLVEVLPAQNPSPNGPLSIDAQISNDKSTASTTNATAAFSTNSPNELLLAFVSSDSKVSPNTTVTGITGGGLTWQLVQRTNVQLGTAEIWRAFATSQLSNATVTVTLSQSVASSVTLVSFIGADPGGTNGSGAIGSTGTGNSGSGGPTASLTTTRAYSWVFAAGNDWNNAVARTPGPGQSLVHQYLATVNDTYWVQAKNSTTPQSGTVVTLNDTAPTSDSYNLSLVEILPVITGSPLQVTAHAAPSPNANGWNNGNVTVSFQCSGGVAPVQCPGQQVISTEGANQVVSGTAVDGIGSTASASVTLNIDKTPPTVSIVSPANGANFTTANITVSGTTSDALSGIASVSCDGVAATIQSGSYSCGLTLGPGTNTISIQATDLAGNVATQTEAVTLITAPAISSVSPQSAPVGTTVNMTGSGFMQGGLTPLVTLSQQGGGTIPAPVTSFSSSNLAFVIPSGAATGPVTVFVDGLSGVSAGSLTVIPSSGFTLSAGPATATLLPGESTTIQISSSSANGFSQLATLNVAGLPAGVTAQFQPSQITAGQFSLLTLSAPASQSPSSSQITVTASATVQGIAQTQATQFALNVASLSGSTAFAGRVAVTDAYDTPLVGVTVSFTGKNYTGANTGCTGTTTTDAAGNFALSGLSSSCVGSQIVTYDPSTITSPPGKYTGVAISYVLAAGQVTDPGVVVHLPRVDNAETVMVQQGAPNDQTFSFHSIPGVSITVYAGTTIALPDGTQPNPFPLSVVEIPYDRVPEKVVPDPTQDPGFAMSIEPFNSTASQPIAVVYPNRKNTVPGTTMPLTTLSPVLGMMVNYGTGTVSPDGTQIIPDPDPANPGHQFGISHFDWEFPLPPPPDSVSPCPVCDGTIPEIGDPIDPASGIPVITKTDLTFGGARGEITLTRTFHGLSFTPGPFGLGTSHNYNYLLNLAYKSTISGASSLIYVGMPDGNQIPFSGPAGGTYTNATIPSMAGVTLSDPGGGSFSLRWKDGTTFEFCQCGGSTVLTASLISISDTNGNKTILVRGIGLPAYLFQVIDPVGRSLNIRYDDSARITSMTDPLGRTVQYTYNPQGMLATVTDAAGGVTRYGYDQNNNLQTVTDPNGNTYTNYYDPAGSGRVVRQVAPDGGTTQFTYQPFNPTAANSPINITTVTDPLGNVTTYHYSAQSFLEDVTDALGQKTVYSLVSGTNQLSSVTDPLGRVTSYKYDSAGNLTSTTSLDGTAAASTISSMYEPVFNKITSTTDALQQTTSFTYDPSNGNLLTITDPLGLQASFTYDPFGERLSSTDPLGKVTSMVYANGNLVSSTDPLGRTTTYTLDPISRRIAITNPLGQTLQSQYDADNRVIRSTDASGHSTSYNYDSTGNLLSVVDANGHTNTYSYDSMNRASSHTDGLGRVERFEFDQNGNLLKFTDRRGKVTTYGYDALNRKASATYGPGESSIAYGYDGGGRLVTVVDSTSGTISRGYDLMDHLTAERTAQGEVSYGYDAAGRRVSMQASGQPLTSYTYDNNSRLLQIVQGTSTVSFSHDANGRRTAMTLPDGVIVNYSYDVASQITGITYQRGNAVLGDLSYSYDLAGRRSAVGGSFARTGVPGAISSASHDSSNELVQWGNKSLQYDGNGELTNDGTNGYTWNARNQLVSISGAVTASFQYDSFGRRTIRSAMGTTTSYLYDGVNPIAEFVGGVQSANLLMGTEPDEYLARQDGSGAASILSDALGNTTAVADANGNIQAQYSYEPFGAAQINGTSSNSYQFTGRENDGTGLYYYRARYYSPQLQRFVSPDPIGLSGGINFYAYVNDEPTNLTDPTGTGGPLDSILNYFVPLPPPPPPVNTAPPAAPPILYTDMASNAAAGGSTTFYPGNGMEPVTIPTRTSPDSKSLAKHPDAGDPYCSTVVGVVHTGGTDARFGVDGAYIKTGDTHGRDIHGGGSGLPDPFDPFQALWWTHGCTRGHNQDVVNLGHFVTTFQKAYPQMPITYCRK
jgi:RHS repeat-associated protein